VFTTAEPFFWLPPPYPPAVGSVHPSDAGERDLAISLTLDPTIVAMLLSDIAKFLQGPHGWMLCDLATPDTALSRISVAIDCIRRNLPHQIRIKALAEMAALSVSALHRHFKAVTALSPLQYQKRPPFACSLAARSGHGSATSIAFGVGCESPNQFSREYARLFGLPPSKDLTNAIRDRQAA
jgi:AraC-like DNA-binding protein